MIVIGAKGLAKEVLEIIELNKATTNLAFYDDVSTDNTALLYDQFPILKNKEQVLKHFKQYDAHYILGIGKPQLRYKLYQKFSALGGMAKSMISPLAQVGGFDVQIAEGTVVFSNAIFSNSSCIGRGSLVYYNAMITHDCILGDFVELSPGATILGSCKIGDLTHIGANATILPNLSIGKNVIVGAGSVVTKDLPDNAIAVGNPARIIDHQKPLSNF